MRARDVEIGHTYVVLAPHRLPVARYPDRERLGTSMWVVSLLTGARFRLTASNVDYDTDPVTVEGLRLIERSHTEVTLTDDQAAALGLAPKQGYRVVGSLVDRTGQVACLPSIEPIRVPVRWLRPADDPRLAQSTHRDADLWPFM